MQAACGVDHDDVASLAARALDRVVGDGRGIASALALDEVGTGALRPDPELFFRGGAVRIGGRNDDGMPVLAQAVGELADRRRLTRAVDTDDEDHARLSRKPDPRRFAEQLRDLLRKRVVQLAEVGPTLEPPYELRRRRHADVAGDQRLFEPLPGRRVAGVEGRRGKLLREGAPAAPERVAQAREEAAALLLGVGGGAVVTEQLSPGSGHGGER